MGVKDSSLKDHKKGELGSILIIGGSDIYTGAPLFTALGSLRAGSELVYIMPSSNTNPLLKCVLEAVVVPFEYNEHILDKITCVVLGPGLGRDITNDKIGCMIKIAEYLNNRSVPFVVDGDGIHYYKQGLFQSVKRLVVTPNKSESEGLKLAKHHYGIFKGRKDEILSEDTKLYVSSKGSLKRVAGQGDILAGVMATFLSVSSKPIEKVCEKSCKFVRKASYLTFKKKGFAMITSDIFKYFPHVLKSTHKKKLKTLIKRLKSTSSMN